MLRFRPIAPKPASGSSSSSGTDPTVKKITRGRLKRKYTRAKKNNNIKNHDEYDVIIHDPTTVKKTLQLFPNHTSASDQGSGRGEPQHSNPNLERLPVLVDNRSIVGLFQSNQFDPSAVEYSVVTVESVTDVCTTRGVELGETDEERVKNLELDTCPGFLSDAYNRVMWINPAFTQMTRVQDISFVTLITKTQLPLEYPAFACVVRVQLLDTTHKDKYCLTSTISRVLPCDVWRMDFGGLAWRLDLSAALSLGR